MKDDRWHFVVRDSAMITGRGTALFGNLTGVIPAPDLPARLDVDGASTRIDAVSVESARTVTGEELALLLIGWSEVVPSGAVVLGPTS